MYESYFHLSAKPFQLSPDVRFFFPSKEHRRALSFLQYGLSQGDGFIVITGDVGTGKTTLVQALLQGLDSKQTVVANLVTTQLDEDDLLHTVANNFGLRLKSTTKAAVLRDLERLFIERAKMGKRALLIVDEAQNLPQRSVEELRMLSNFQHEGKALLQIFLLGQEEFRGTLLGEGFEQLRQRVIATYHLNPLDETESQTYIEHRLTRAGWDHHPEFTEDAYHAIFEFTDGVPRRINNLCDRLLLFTYLEERNSIDQGTVQSVSEEIGTEFWGGRPRRDAPPTAQPVPAPGTAPANENGVFDAPSQPLETMARVMFDKANVQQRLATLERAIDGLGHSVKEELGEIRMSIDLLQATLDGIRASVELPQVKGNAVDISTELDAIAKPKIAK